MHAEGFDAISGGFLAVVNIIGQHEDGHGRCPAHIPCRGHPDCPVIAVIRALTDVRLYVSLPAMRDLKRLRRFCCNELNAAGPLGASRNQILHSLREQAIA